MELIVSHGYFPSKLSQTYVISIPKDNRGNMQSSENYRGISLCNSLCKVFDLWVLSKCSNLMDSSNHQFAFKAIHSTVLCTTMVKQITSFYNKVFLA